jgi:hypothetical protein
MEAGWAGASTDSLRAALADVAAMQRISGHYAYAMCMDSRAGCDSGTAHLFLWLRKETDRNSCCMCGECCYMLAVTHSDWLSAVYVAFCAGSMLTAVAPSTSTCVWHGPA